ncbi:MAG: cytidylate kinase-like family protein, partial [Bacteroidales bacterium]|nr:cytidylate kinase-like family protein [Bacteroidales bacterium]
AEESGFSKDLFRRSDEKRSLFTMSTFFSPWRYEVGENYVNDDALFRIQSDVIREIASKDSAIIIGRCSDYILRDMKCLDVFISAPLEYRIKRVADREKMSEDDARALIAKKDRTRETYYNYFTFGNWGVASNYDLCIDSSILGIEGTADIIIEAGKKMGIIQ